MIIGCTGHRKIGGSYSTSTPLYKHLVDKTTEFLLAKEPEKCITGMALGYDLLFAEVCIGLRIPFVGAIPFAGQDSRWPIGSRRRYQRALDCATEILTVSPGGWDPVEEDEPTGAQKMHIRNKWIVNQSDLMLSYFDGSPGGTEQCLDYAEEVGVPCHIIELP